jgi:hypothetical protein
VVQYNNEQEVFIEEPDDSEQQYTAPARNGGGKRKHTSNMAFGGSLRSVVLLSVCLTLRSPVQSFVVSQPSSTSPWINDPPFVSYPVPGPPTSFYSPDFILDQPISSATSTGTLNMLQLARVRPAAPNLIMDWLWDLGSSYFARSNSFATTLGAGARQQ